MSYTETRSISFPTATYSRSWTDGLNPVPDWTRASGPVTATRTRVGDRNPHWREQIAQGLNATTDLTGVWESLSYHGIPQSDMFEEIWKSPTQPANLFHRQAWGDLYWRNADHIISIKHVVTDPTFVDNLARAAFIRKVKAETMKFHGEVFLGELRETLHMLHRPAFGLQKLIKEYYDSLRKRKRVAPKSWLNSINELWLEQSFGWNPLLADIRDAISAYEKKTSTERQHHISAGARKEYDTTKQQLSGTNLLPGKGWNALHIVFRTISSSVVERISVRYRGAVRAQVEAPTWQDKSLLWGFSPQEFIPTAWELLPWSFLIDYFTNIGDILDCSVASLNSLVYVNKSTVKECFARYLFKMRTDVSPGGDYKLLYSHDPGRGDVSTYAKNVSRVKGSGVETPSLQFNFNLTDGQLLNCAALLAQVSGILHPQSQPRRWNGHL